MHKIIPITIIIILLCLVCFIVVTNEKDLTKYSFYAYGDSIANGHSALTNYLIMLRENYNIQGEIFFNSDGNAKNTTWAVNNFKNHLKYITDKSKLIGYKFIVLEAFGFVDEYNSIKPIVVARNKLTMFNMSKEMNIENYFVCIPIQGNSSYDDAKEYINVMENLFTMFGVPFVNLYDAVDIVPFNNQFDGFDNSSYFMDGIHPNEKGYVQMTNYIWEWLNENKDEMQ